MSYLPTLDAKLYNDLELMLFRGFEQDANAKDIVKQVVDYVDANFTMERR